MNLTLGKNRPADHETAPTITRQRPDTVATPLAWPAIPRRGGCRGLPSRPRFDLEDYRGLCIGVVVHVVPLLAE
jgi:hypothetical protein